VWSWLTQGTKETALGNRRTCCRGSCGQAGAKEEAIRLRPRHRAESGSAVGGPVSRPLQRPHGSLIPRTWSDTSGLGGDEASNHFFHLLALNWLLFSNLTSKPTLSLSLLMRLPSPSTSPATRRRGPCPWWRGELANARRHSHRSSNVHQSQSQRPQQKPICCGGRLCRARHPLGADGAAPSLVIHAARKFHSGMDIINSSI
jgi:hypothetical protein